MNLGELISQYPMETIVATIGFVTIAVLSAGTFKNICGAARIDRLTSKLKNGNLGLDDIAVEFARDVTPRRCQLLSFLSRKH